MDELVIDQIDFTRFKDLNDFYYESVRIFSYMMSRNIPEYYELKGDCASEKDNEIYSSKEGIIALTNCANMLKQQRDGKKVDDGYKNLETLSDWYTEALIKFTHDILNLAPVELYIDEGNKLSTAINVFEQCAKDLEDSLRDG